MKHIKSLSLFENSQDLDQEQIDFLNQHTTGEWEVNPNTELVDIKGYFSVSERRLGSFKGVKFGETNLSFYCSTNRLTSLEGAPQRVGGNFHCSRNFLTSLEGAPKEVGGDFSCSDNSLTSLEGAPERVGGDFYCGRNFLTSLKGAPEKISGGFYWNKFGLDKGEWNPLGWLNILREGSEEAKKLILTLPYFNLENLQIEINKNPGKWVMILKDVWNLPSFRPKRDQLKVSDRFLKDIGAQSTLSDLGF